MPSIKQKLGLPPLSPITNPSSEQKVSELDSWDSTELENKIDDFEGTWGSSEESSPTVETEQQLSQQQQNLPGWGSEVESDSDDDMPPLEE